jgi:hypothetical protein
VRHRVDPAPGDPEEEKRESWDAARARDRAPRARSDQPHLEDWDDEIVRRAIVRRCLAALHHAPITSA